MVFLPACTRQSGSPFFTWRAEEPALSQTAIARLTEAADSQTVLLPLVEGAARPAATPTPDAPRRLPTPRLEAVEYVVEANDTLLSIARRYQVSLQAIIEANGLTNPDYLEVGQVLVIPPPVLGEPGSGFKILPDSELVYGPASVDFDVADFIQARNGYLAGYTEEVNQRLLSGAQIVERIAQEFSVNPRLLLAVLEYRSGWVTQAQPAEGTLDYPIGVVEPWRKGLYLQLAYAANNLNRGYYLWRANAVGYWLLADGELTPIAPTLNAGTAGVQQLFALLLSRAAWDAAVGEAGLIQTYRLFFGDPFARAVEPLLPLGLQQPVLQLPFEAGEVWSFTGGPHGGWGDGSAWAALDFAPPGKPLGCAQSDAWVTAVGNGAILRAEDGAVIQDLDLAEDQPNDGKEQTGWVILYMHIEARQRVLPGAYLRAGDRIGHPSCEGGISSGTHVHLARRYNGEWIPADGDLPFVLDGWVSQGAGKEYDGFLRKGDRLVEAWEGDVEVNKISR